MLQRSLIVLHVLLVSGVAGAPCAGGALTVTCECGVGLTVCDPNEMSTPAVGESISTAKTWCDIGSSTCTNPCAQSPVSNNVSFSKNPEGQPDGAGYSTCMCGTTVCIYSFANTQAYCEPSTNTCAKYATCSNTDKTLKLVKPTDTSVLNSNNEYCQCGTAACTFQKGVQLSSGPDLYLGDTHDFCNAATNECTYAPCSSGTLTGACTCGAEVCYPEGVSDVTVTCQSSSDGTKKCHVPCKNDNGPTDLVGLQTSTGRIAKGMRSSCACGTATCDASINHHISMYNNRVCDAAASRCLRYPICSNTDGSAVLVEPDFNNLGLNFVGDQSGDPEQVFCQCGQTLCGFAPNQYISKSHEYCNAALDQCTYEPCANTDGTQGNPGRCQCSLDSCDRPAEVSAESKYFCNTANNMCGVTAEVNTFSITKPVVPGTSAVDVHGWNIVGGANDQNKGQYGDLGQYGGPTGFYQKCSAVAGKSIIKDVNDCFEAAAAKGARFQAVTRTILPAGCVLTSRHDIVFNSAPAKFAGDETVSFVLMILFALSISYTRSLVSFVSFF